MANSSSSALLDHVIILVSHATLLTIPSRLRDAFTVVVGGDHADGLTTNALVLFEDGVYLEFIAFFDAADPDKRKQHRWGELPENTVVDFAYTLAHERDFASVQKRVEGADAGYVYTDPRPGGRKRPDGEVLEWAIGAPKKAGEDGPFVIAELPFWCLDRTPRHLRVPYIDNPQTKHPSGARGVARLELRVAESQLLSLTSVYSAIHQSEPENQAWKFSTPSGIELHDQIIHLTKSEKGTQLGLVLSGDSESPSEVEVLPGIVFGFRN